MTSFQRLASLFSFAVGACVIAHASPTLVHLYTFNGNLNDSVGSVALQNNSGGVVGSGVFTFGANQGPTLVAESSLATNYSIGLQFSLTFGQNGGDLDGNPWTSILNLSNLSQDTLNQYLLVGQPVFYPITSQGSDVVPNNTTVDMLLTWDGTNYRSYLNGNLENSFTNPGLANAAIVGGNSVFQFFQDDGHSAESTPGSLYQLRVWNGALTGDQVNTAFQPVNPTSNVPDEGSLTLVLAGVFVALIAVRRRLA